MPKELEQVFRQAAKKHGVDLDRDMFVNDNSQCATDDEITFM